jgi:uncharacterized protein YyaL (SSP411 family)
MPGFRRVLEHVSEAYQSRREDVEAASAEVVRSLSTVKFQGGGALEHDALDRAAARIAQGYDPAHGGFGGAPKFPPSMSLDFLMQVAWRTGDKGLDQIITHTLTKMARGGMCDQVGGGFHRYSTDAHWLVPHFEKMLYDNALLARLYTRAWQYMKDPFFARIASEILGFVQREMTSPDGGFYATQDADSEGVEGKFYVWSRAEVMTLLGEEEGRIFCARDPESVAADLGITIDHLIDVAARGKCKLYGARSQRIWPARDEKILAGWNGWMLVAFAEGAIAFDKDSYRDVVRRNADFLLTRINASGRLMRTPKIAGLLEDYSGVAWGLALAYEATHERRYLDSARQLADQILDRFADAQNGGFFDTPTDHEALITRPKDLFDNATPSGNSVAADVLLRLALLFGEEQYAEAATKTIAAVAPLAERYPSGFGLLLGVAEWRAGQPKEIVITGDTDDATFRALRKAVGEEYLPHRVLVAGSGSADLPRMEKRPADRAMAYVCEAYACAEPTADAQRLRVLLQIAKA